MIDAGIFEGDIALIAPHVEPANRDMVVALIEEEATIKRFFLKNGTVKLVPENKGMEPITLNAKDVKIIGKVVGILRRL